MPTSDEFTNHRVCSLNSWLSGVEISRDVPFPKPKQQSLHPKARDSWLTTRIVKGSPPGLAGGACTPWSVVSGSRGIDDHPGVAVLSQRRLPSGPEQEPEVGQVEDAAQDPETEDEGRPLETTE